MNIHRVCAAAEGGVCGCRPGQYWRYGWFHGDSQLQAGV